MSGLPNLPPGLPKGLKDYLVKLGEQFEVTQSDRGSPLDAKPTIQDLIDLGVLKSSLGQTLQANGKSFTLDGVTNWLQSGIPDWFTSLLNPPAPAGLVVTMNTANIVLSWTPWVSNFYLQTLVYRATSNNLSVATQIGSTAGSTYVDNLPPVGVSYYYWIRTQAKSTNVSDFNQVSGTTVGNAVGAPTISATFDGPNVVLSWPTPVTTLQIKYYVVRYGTTFEGGIDVGVSNTNTLRALALFGGTRRFWIAAVDINDNLGTPGFVDATVAAPAAPTVGQSLANDTLVLTFSSAQVTLPVTSYEIRYGASFAAGTPVLVGSQTRYETPVNWTGGRTFWVAAYDTAGNISTVTQSVFTPTAPAATSVIAQVIDNNVLLSWSVVAGSLSVSHYIVDRGGVSVGTLSGRFTTLYETVAGDYTYGITAVDTAGNQGARSTATASVAQPPDFVLFSSANSSFAGSSSAVTITNASPGVVTWTEHLWPADTPIVLSTTGSLPSPLVAGAVYYVKSPGTGTFQLASSPGGTAINTTTAGSGTHTATTLGLHALVDPASGGLLVNVDTSETWDSHFSSRGWTNIDDQVAAGYSTYFVGKTTGNYVEAVDYGATIPGTKIKLTPTQYAASGSAVTQTSRIDVGTNGVNWPTSYPGVSEAFATAFRYVRYSIAFTASHNGSGLADDTSALLTIKPLNFRLDVKQKTHQGMVSALAADSGGTSVDITGIFVDVSAIEVSALGTTPLFVVYDFTDSANPTSFKVLVFNSSGTRVNATVSYTLRGV